MKEIEETPEISLKELKKELLHVLHDYGIPEFTLQAVKPRTSGRGCKASSNNV